MYGGRGFSSKSNGNDRPIVVLIKRKNEIENEKPVRTTGRLIVFFLLNIKIKIAEGSENARPLANILFSFRNEKVRKKPGVLIVLMSTR